MLNKTKPISPYQFALFRILLGMYLSIHFFQLLPYGSELFERNGVIDNSDSNPFPLLFPTPLAYWGSDFFIRGLLSLATLLSILFMLGICRRFNAVLLWFIWASLIDRNNLISNLSLPYVGLLLLLCALIPKGEPLSFGRIFSTDPQKDSDSWKFPLMIYVCAWLAMAAGYTFSGIVKLQSPSWISGEAIMILMESPLARPGLIKDFCLSLPPIILKLFTWFSLFLEIGFLFASIHKWGRLGAWLGLIGIHIGISLVVDFTDLTMGILMLHLFTFDPDWLPCPKQRKNSKNVVFFDGDCLICNTSVRFLIREDYNHNLLYAPLQGETFKEIERKSDTRENLKSIQFIPCFENGGKPFTHSSAIIQILRTIGGFWTFVAFCIWIIPKPIRNSCYNFVASNRYRWFGKTKEFCSIPKQEDTQRLLP